jgi:hypothetical protein
MMLKLKYKDNRVVLTKYINQPYDSASVVVYDFDKVRHQLLQLIRRGGWGLKIIGIKLPQEHIDNITHKSVKISIDREANPKKLLSRTFYHLTIYNSCEFPKFVEHYIYHFHYMPKIYISCDANCSGLLFYVLMENKYCHTVKIDNQLFKIYRSHPLLHRIYTIKFNKILCQPVPGLSSLTNVLVIDNTSSRIGDILQSIVDKNEVNVIREIKKIIVILYKLGFSKLVIFIILNHTYPLNIIYYEGRIWVHV